METRSARIALTLWSVLVVLFLWIPLALIILYAFNKSNVESWPIPGLTTRWFHAAWTSEVRASAWLSVRVGLIATGIALVLGSMAAFGVARFRFFGREAVSFLVLLPIALPGIVTGMALNATFREVLEPFGVGLGLFTVIVGHATFCIVVIFNNAVARLRRMSSSFEEASADLGASTWQTFRYVTFPALRSALVAGALLAFALSFDEVIVTTFTAGAQNTLPIWIFGQIRLGQQLPQVNVVVFLILLVTILPVALAQRMTRESGILRTE